MRVKNFSPMHFQHWLSFQCNSVPYRTSKLGKIRHRNSIGQVLIRRFPKFPLRYSLVSTGMFNQYQVIYQNRDFVLSFINPGNVRYIYTSNKIHYSHFTHHRRRIRFTKKCFTFFKPLR